MELVKVENRKKIKLVPQLRFPEFEGKWTIKRIDEITVRISDPVKVEKNSLYQQIGIRSHGKGLFHKELVEGKTLGNKRIFWIKENMFIVNIVFAWEQAVAKTTKAEIGMVASHRFPMYKPVEGKLVLDFILTLFLTKKGKYLLGLASPGGAGRNKTLGQQTFNELKINLPSFPEQQKIASFLSVVDKKIQQLTRKTELMEQYKKGVMQKLFSREIRFKDDNGNDYPDWEEKRLGDIGMTYNGLSGKSSEDFGEGVSYVTYKQIFDNSKIDITKFNYVRIEPGEKQNKVEYGDVFFTTSSESRLEVGFASVLLDEIEELYLNSFCFGYRINLHDEFLPKFARFLFRSEGFRKEIVKLGQGITRYNMSKNEMKKLEIQLPTNDEQMKIAEFLSNIDNKIDAVKTQLTQTQTFKKGLLQQLLV